MHYTLINCTALHCTSLRYTVLHCAALHCVEMHCTELHCTELRCTALHCTSLHYSALHCTAVQCTALHNIVIVPLLSYTHTDREHLFNQNWYNPFIIFYFVLSLTALLRATNIKPLNQIILGRFKTCLHGQAFYLVESTQPG